jgi:hypothetical protein
MKTFALVAVLACRTPEPVFIDEPLVKPLPPASGTPIGILLDDSGQLNLRPEQRAKLEEIDRKLATRNDVLAGAQRSSERPPPPTGGPGGGMGGPGGGMGGPGGGMGGPGGGMGGPGGGMGGPGGGMGGPGGGMGGMGGPGGGMGGPGGGPPGGGRGRGGPRPTGAHKNVEAEIAANIHAAIDEALALLDPDQRLKAEALLDERGALPSKQRPPGPPPGSERERPD